MIINRRTAVAGMLGTAVTAPALVKAATPGRVPKEVLTFYYGWYANPTFSNRWFHWQGPTGTEAPLQSRRSITRPGACMTATIPAS